MSATSTCQSCGEAVSTDDRFCPACGAERVTASPGAETVVAPATAATHCPACAAPVVGTPSFCSSCGASLQEAATVPSVGSLERLTTERLTEATTGEFEVLQRIGHGAMGSVYLARDVALSRRVAIKVISPQLLQDESMVARFRLEAQTVAALRHPNIVNLHAVRQLGDLHYFIMDFIDGPSLRSVMKAHAPLEIPVALALLFQVGSALSYAHRRGRGVIHRDVKPANVMVDREGNAVVMDFGISKVGAVQSGLTQTGATIGTPEYMSPEQCMDKELSGASDQYALGIVAYEMLTGGVPFKGSTYAIMMAHAQGTPPPIREQRPDCPEDVEVAVMRMLAKEPADRFPDLQDAVAAMGGQPLGHRDAVRDRIVALVASVAHDEEADLDESSPLSPVPASRVPSTEGVAAPTASSARPTAPPASSTPPPPAAAAPSDPQPASTAALPAGSDKTVLVTADPPEDPAASAGSGSPGAAQSGRDVPDASPRRWGRRAAVAAAVLAVAAVGVGQLGRTPATDGASASVVLPTVTDTMRPGDTVRLAATIVSDGSTLPATAGVWTSSDPRIVTVSAAGAVVAHAAGLATVTLRYDEAEAETRLVVAAGEVVAAATAGGDTGPAAAPPSTAGGGGASSTSPPATGSTTAPETEPSTDPDPASPVVETVRIVGGSDGLRVGATVPIGATGHAADGSVVPNVDIAWSSSDESTAVVRGEELVGVGAGVVTITATLGGASGSTRVAVLPLPDRDDVIEMIQERVVRIIGNRDTDGIERLLARDGRGQRPTELFNALREQNLRAQLDSLGEVTSRGNGAMVDFRVAVAWRGRGGGRAERDELFRALMRPTVDGWRLEGVSRLQR